MEVGGLYHITQECFKGYDALDSDELADCTRVEACATDVGCREMGFSGSVDVGVVRDDLLRSTADPGVLMGVFALAPKDANAPWPSAKAEDAPGATVMLVFRGEAPFGKAALVGVSEPARCLRGG